MSTIYSFSHAVYPFSPKVKMHYTSMNDRHHEEWCRRLLSVLADLSVLRDQLLWWLILLVHPLCLRKWPVSIRKYEPTYIYTSEGTHAIRRRKGNENMRGKRNFVLPLVNNVQVTTCFNTEIGSLWHLTVISWTDQQCSVETLTSYIEIMSKVWSEHFPEPCISYFQ